MNTSFAAPGSPTHHLQRRTTWNTYPPRALNCLLNPKWPSGGCNRLAKLINRFLEEFFFYIRLKRNSPSIAILGCGPRKVICT